MGIRQIIFDEVESVGAVRRVSFRYQDEKTRDWAYFGSTEAEYPPTEGVVTEYAVVQLPSDLDNLPPEFDYLLHDLALIIGRQREGL